MQNEAEQCKVMKAKQWQAMDNGLQCKTLQSGTKNKMQSNKNMAKQSEANRSNASSQGF